MSLPTSNNNQLASSILKINECIKKIQTRFETKKIAAMPSEDFRLLDKFIDQNGIEIFMVFKSVTNDCCEIIHQANHDMILQKNDQDKQQVFMKITIMSEIMYIVLKKFIKKTDSDEKLEEEDNLQLCREVLTLFRQYQEVIRIFRAYTESIKLITILAATTTPKKTTRKTNKKKTKSFKQDKIGLVILFVLAVLVFTFLVLFSKSTSK